MKRFSEHNPIALAVYYLAIICVVMFSMNPVLIFISLFGAITLFCMQNSKSQARSQLAFFLLFMVTALINPLVSHNGATVLLVMNNSPITLEATVYGVCAASMITACIYWFLSFSVVMTEDKLLYVFGKLSPKLSLVLSMGLRFVPMFQNHFKKTRDAQRAMGIYSEDSIIDKVKSAVRVFSVTVTWALENGIITADSMSARGYGQSKRTHFSLFSFKKPDIFLLLSTALLFSLTAASLAVGALDFEFYPTMKIASATFLSHIGYTGYLLLAFLPTFIDVKENIKWHSLRSKI